MKHNWKDIAAKILTTDTEEVTITVNYSNRNKSVLVSILRSDVSWWFRGEPEWFRIHYDKTDEYPFSVLCGKGLVMRCRYVQDAIDGVNERLVKYIL